MRVDNHVIVAGASATGMYAAIGAAKAGFDVTVVDKYARQATRSTVFNLAPTVGDSLDRLDGGSTELISALQLIVKRSSDDAVRGVSKVENVGDTLLVDPRRSLTADAVAAGFSGDDPRPWSRVEIAGIENHLRSYAETAYPQIQLRWGTSVEGVRQTSRGVMAELTDRGSGATDTLEGAWLVSATGGRNPLGIERQLFPEQAHYVGGLFEPVSPDRVELRRLFTPGTDLAPETQSLNPPGEGWRTVGLPGTGRLELPNTLIWAQVAADATSIPDEQLRAVLQDRARLLDLGDLRLRDDLADPILKVDVQLGLLRDRPAVQGRVLLAGDELLAPYFPTSTGASHGLGVSGPLVEDTLRNLRGANAEQRQWVLTHYDRTARSEATKIMEISRSQLRDDLELPTLARWDEGLGDVTSGIGEAAP